MGDISIPENDRSTRVEESGVIGGHVKLHSRLEDAVILTIPHGGGESRTCD